MPRRSPNARDSACPRQIPTSSTVWCWSTCKSPLASTLRSKAPCRAKSSSMWSRKPTPVCQLPWPLPSRFNSRRIWVSRVLRVIVAVRGISHHGFEKGQRGFNLFVGPHADSQAVAPAGIVHVADEDAVLLELLVERFGGGSRVSTPDEVGLG